MSQELQASQRASQDAAKDADIFKHQLDTLLDEARSYQDTIRDLQDQVHRAAQQNVRASMSASPLRRPSVASESASQPWDQALNNNLLQAKIEEIRVLREQVSSLQQNQSAEFQKHQSTVAALRKENEELLRKCTDLSVSNGELKAQFDQKMDGASTINSSIDFAYSMATKSVDGEADAQATAHHQAMDASIHVSSMRQLEESLQHQIDLAQITADELTEERTKAREMRTREVRLFQLLAEVEKVYKTQLHALRQELMQVRATVDSIGPFTQLEVRKTVAGLAGHLNFIFHNWEEKKAEELRTVRIALSLAHSDEINALESRFVQQIQTQAAEHSRELEQVHGELVRKTEDALGWTHYTDAVAHKESTASNNEDDIAFAEQGEKEDEEYVFDAHGHLQRAAPPQNVRAVSFASDMTSTLSKHRRSSTTTTTSTTTSVSGSASTRRASLANVPPSLSAQSGAASSRHAFPSVLTGVLEALTVEDILDKTTSQQIVSLAKAHQEPSFAAQAAAKSLLSGHLEKFLNALLERTAAAAAATNGSSPGGDSVSTQRSYTGYNYNVFFDS